MSSYPLPKPSKSAQLADKVAKGMNAVKKGVGDYVDQAKAVAGIGSDAAKAARSVGETTRQEDDFLKGQQPNTSAPKPDGSFKKGGKVKKTGVYKLHSGERVLNRQQTKKFDRGGSSRAKSGGAKRKPGGWFSPGYEPHNAIGSY